MTTYLRGIWRTNARSWLALLLTVVAVVVAGICRTYWHAATPENSQPIADAPASFSSKRQNSSADEGYVGIAACAECHPNEYRTYQNTAHSLALSEPDAAKEPAGGSFFHAASGRTYTVYREGDHWRHRESATDDQGNDYVTADYQVRYLIGSGRHTRSYLIEADGFLFESPLTWYASRKSWGMSPGYDRPNHRGFERAADATCLFCHVGRVAASYLGYQRFTFPEQPIGCERCHGPGLQHATAQRAIREGNSLAQGANGSIVQPARLSRALLESICAQCHLNGDAMVNVRGRSLADFRPSLPLADFCVDYRPKVADTRMKVVGHMDQLRLSRCYQSSETLTCTTCHDPHSNESPERARLRNVAACAKCHPGDSCRCDPQERSRHDPKSDCISCHMPQVPTEIQHIAFTHHRIGVHREDRAAPLPTEEPQRPSELVPTTDVTSESDSARNAGLAYFAMSQKQADPESAEAYRDRARQLLLSAHSRGQSDGEADAALARLLRERESAAALRLARESLRDQSLSPKSRVNSLFLIAEVEVRENRYSSARQVLEELTAVRRLSEDWRLLALCHQSSGDVPGALHSLEKAIEIAPFRPELHAALAGLLQHAGRADAARRESATAERLAALGNRRH